MRLSLSLIFALSVVVVRSHIHRRRNIDELLDCSRLVDGNYPNPNERCSPTFVTCDNGLTLKRTCNENTFYDELVDDCAEKKFVRACGGELPQVKEEDVTVPPPAVVDVTDAPQSTTVETAGATTAVDHIFFNCAGLRPGNYPNPAAKDGCSPIFFSCGAARRPHLMQCPGRTYYDDEIDTCNYFSDVPKCSGIPRVKTTPAEPGLTTTTAPDPFNCKKLPDGNYAPPKEETTCPTYFYQCANRRGFRVNCPIPELRYDIKQDACVLPFEIPACANSSN